jgi:hypothetical protein
MQRDVEGSPAVPLPIIASVLGGMLVLMEDAAEAVASADAEERAGVRMGDGRRQQFSPAGQHPAFP